MKRLNFQPYMHSSSGKEKDICAVCGEEGKGTYRALVASKKSAQQVVQMFNDLGLFAKIFSHDSKAPDVAFSRCEKHYQRVQDFEKAHEQTKTITYKSLADYLIR